jgi:uncharacterized protein YodC (DUF2158 family)
VRLKSGGPEMTVREVKKGVVTCDWHEGSKTRRETYFAQQLVSTERTLDNIEVARRILFILNRGAREADPASEPRTLEDYSNILAKDNRNK